MNEILRDLSTPDVVGAIEENLFAFFPLFRHLPGAETVLGPGFMRTLTGIPFPLFNSIMRTRLEPQEVEPAVRDVIASGRSRRVPLLWWTGPSTRPADLGRALEAHGFAHEADAPGMALDLSAVADPVPSGPDLTLAEVEDRPALDLWCRTAALGFEMPPFVQAAWSDWFAGIGLDPRGPLFHFLGFWQGEPVGTASLFLDGTTAGLYNIAVVPQARRQGIGAALTIAPLKKARAMGYRVGILHATPTGLPLYERLGFREYCRIGHYIKE